MYVINNGVFYDITPLRKTSENLTNPLVTTNSSSVVTVTDTSHGAETGDFIVIKQATAVGGISADTINRLEGYQITKVDANSYTFVAGSQASSGATGGGTAIDIQYLIGNTDGVGFQSSDPALGWGVGAWGAEDLERTARDVSSSTIHIDATNWSLELWGDDVLINNRGGQLYYWDTSAGDSARAVSSF